MKSPVITILSGMLTLAALVSNAQEKVSTEEAELKTEVVLMAPPGSEHISSYDFVRSLSGREHMVTARVDSVSKSRDSLELHIYEGNLIVKLGQKDMKKLTDWIGGDILKKVIMVKGTVVPYLDKFTIRVERLRQIAVMPED